MQFYKAAFFDDFNKMWNQMKNTFGISIPRFTNVQQQAIVGYDLIMVKLIEGDFEGKRKRKYIGIRF